MILIDSPITPYSKEDDLKAWRDECIKQSNDAPNLTDHQAWLDELAIVEGYISSPKT